MFRWCIKEQKGTSMVSVMAAFVILILGVLMTSTAIMTAVRVSDRASQMKKSGDEAAAKYYLGTGEYTSDKMTITIEQKGNPTVGIAQFEGEYRAYVHTPSVGTNNFFLYSFRSVNDVEEAQE